MNKYAKKSLSTHLISSIGEIVLTRDILKKIRTDLVKLAKANSRLIRVYKIIYWSNGHKVVGFMIEPRSGDKVMPCIIYNRGGSGNFGALKLGQLFVDLADFAKAGYIVIASQYSGAGGSEGADKFGGKDINDVLVLKDILKFIPRADITRIGMYGHSRGGLMVYLSLAKIKWLRAAVTIGAPTDQLQAIKFRVDWRQHQIKMWGGKKNENMKRSPLYWVNRFNKKTPLLVMHGTADWRVNPLDSIRLAQEMYKYKIPFRLVLFEGGDHQLSEFRHDYFTLALNWLNIFVKNKSVLPKLKPHGN